MEHQCVKCATEMVRARAYNPLTGTLTAYKEPVKALGVNKWSALNVYVCPNCGFAEWYAENPEVFGE